MKITLTIMLTLGLIFSYAQNSLWIYFESEKEFLNESDYHLYYNNSLIYTNCYLKNNDNVLYNLKKGLYLLKYETVFGVDSIQIKFDETDTEKYITLKTEQLDESIIEQTKSFIDSIKENEKLELTYHVGGCFIDETFKSTIVKFNDKFYKIKDNKKVRISKNKLDKLIVYEKEISHLKLNQSLGQKSIFDGCSESFRISKNDSTVLHKEGFCGEWSKFKRIKKLLR